ncbi:hypothetical protein ACJ73_05703 [Blastomyces percursus]|uniref:Uncharacterized protein n=1 Tax=Blastomyces percursus TaxID=1658174 RepID=A0A1J9Q346_9EURO|nr:hypothetical protein ACJ73_05703 [Blastomyces percursus]
MARTRRQTSAVQTANAYKLRSREVRHPDIPHRRSITRPRRRHAVSHDAPEGHDAQDAPDGHNAHVGRDAHDDHDTPDDDVHDDRNAHVDHNVYDDHAGPDVGLDIFLRIILFVLD